MKLSQAEPLGLVAEDVPAALRLLETVDARLYPSVRITIGRGRLWRYLEAKFEPAHRRLLARINAPWPKRGRS